MRYSTKISVVVTCYNQEKYIQECLNSLVNQTFDDFEVVVVDDGSSDNSLKIIYSFLRKIKKLKVIEQENQGVISARNNGINQSCGEYIYTLDGDDYLDEKTIQCVYDAALLGKGDVITTNARCFGRQNFPLYFNSINKINMSGINCLLNAALFKKSDFIKAGGYDERFKEGFEDYDLWLNFLFNLNLRFYRVSSYMYFYRLKNVEESRNFYAVERHKKELLNLLEKKYPKIILYKILYKIKKFIFFKRYSIRKKSYIYTFFYLFKFSFNK